MASLTLESRHLVVERVGSNAQRQRFFGWTRSCYNVDGSRIMTAYEPMPMSLVSADGVVREYEINGFMEREGSDMLDMSCVATSKATGGRLLPRN